MFARISLAMIAMLPGSAVSCLAATHEVGVYLRSDGGTSPAVVEAMRVEMDTVLNRAGFTVKWWIGQEAKGPFEAEELIVVDLRGACKVPRPVLPPKLSRPTSFSIELASTSVADSQVLPFSSLDCKTFNDLLLTSLTHFALSRREFVYGRALARVLAHEFYHVLVRTNKHTAKGVAKKSHSADDLVAEHFDFDQVALTQLLNIRQTPMIAGNKAGNKKETAPEGASGEAPAEAVVVVNDNPNTRQ